MPGPGPNPPWKAFWITFPDGSALGWDDKIFAVKPVTGATLYFSRETGQPVSDPDAQE